MSTIEKWSAVDQYMSDVLIPKDSTLEEVLQANAAANLPTHDGCIANAREFFTNISTNSRGS